MRRIVAVAALLAWALALLVIDGDGNVGITDFLILLANWGPCT